MTNGELIQKCTGQCCAECDYHSQCEIFKRIYGKLPEEVGNMVGDVIKINIVASMPINEVWLDSDMGVALFKSIISNLLDEWIEESEVGE